MSSSVVGTDISPGYRTDHSLVNMNIKFSTIKRGSGYWKFNNELLKDEKFVTMIKNKIIETVKLCAKDPLSIQENSTYSYDCEMSIDDQLFFETLMMI